ncbi:hypothetical protein GBA52_005728 [Prunus armeniaca]|nr:hypothetical protein GBA52_005728 [Prunus armeniaca]
MCMYASLVLLCLLIVHHHHDKRLHPATRVSAVAEEAEKPDIFYRVNIYHLDAASFVGISSSSERR